MRLIALLLAGPLLAAPAFAACACAEPEPPSCHSPSDCCPTERSEDCPKALKFLDNADSYALSLDLEAPAPAPGFAAVEPPKPDFEAQERFDALPPGRLVPCPLLL